MNKFIFFAHRWRWLKARLCSLLTPVTKRNDHGGICDTQIRHTHPLPLPTYTHLFYFSFTKIQFKHYAVGGEEKVKHRRCERRVERHGLSEP